MVKLSRNSCPATRSAARPAYSAPAPGVRRVPAANGRMIAAKTCLYTVTPDHHFIVDRMPGAANVIVASACSGHGFKFAPVLGDVLADLAIDGATRHDISRFRLARFA